MQPHVIDEIIACLPKGRTLFHYFKDRYALMLLSYFVKNGKTMKEIKTSRYAGLLNKPIVKEVTSRLPGKNLTPDHFQFIWPDKYETYLLGLDRWGSIRDWKYYQVSRPGENLVLQLNFSNKHNTHYVRWINPEKGNIPFSFEGHPISKEKLTLAWARLDIDLQQGQALIEEIQNDWIRETLDWQKHLKRYPKKFVFGTQCSLKELNRYFKDGLYPHIKIWHEAMLMAAIWFLKEELGINQIFFHTYNTGNYFKKFYYNAPPRSLYTDLPRKFCFVETHEAPEFLQKTNHRTVKTKLKDKSNKWFVLNF